MTDGVVRRLPVNGFVISVYALFQSDENSNCVNCGTRLAISVQQ